MVDGQTRADRQRHPVASDIIRTGGNVGAGLLALGIGGVHHAIEIGRWGWRRNPGAGTLSTNAATSVPRVGAVPILLPTPGNSTQLIRHSRIPIQTVDAAVHRRDTANRRNCDDTSADSCGGGFLPAREAA